MWDRKELKARAKEVVKRNYWTAVVTCFLVALLTGEFGTSIIIKQDESLRPNFFINHQNIIENIEKEKNIKETLNDTQINIIKAIEANLNSATKSQKYIFKIWDAINSFQINRTAIGTILIIGAILAFLFIVFIADPLTVGGKRYFFKARNNNAKIGEIKVIFQKGNLLNIAITMFLRNIYNALWYLTIIGGVIKTYEYRMIPYILAENPRIKRKEAFELSKQMMKGNKWKTFILDMSFFGWNFLSVLTLGILSIFYVNPYNAATIAELYATLKTKAIDQKYKYYESLNNEI